MKKADLKKKAVALSLPVTFFYPLNCAPGEDVFETARKRDEDSYRAKHAAHRKDYEPSKMILADLDGKHIWRNVHTGGQEITDSVRADQWGHYEPLGKKKKDIYQSPLGVGIHYGEVFLIEHWVLCDQLSEEQETAWNLFEKTFRAEVAMRESGKKAAQLELF